MQRSGCFSIDDVLRYFAGRLGDDQLARVDAHLEACVDCRRLLDEGAREAASGSLRAARSLSDEVATYACGTKIAGRYSIDRFIASGGMGEVYQATDHLVNEQVALKSVRSGLRGDAGALDRLRRELRLARQISHPNVCRVFDFVVDEGTQAVPAVAFLTMEFLSGETLRRTLLTEIRLSARRSLDIWGQMLLGLQAAHAVGVIHRDLKPDNVMLVPAGTQGLRAVITDFGLARTARSDLAWNTGSGLVGTIGYIAPEQVVSRQVTAAADVYSAGVVLYEMLTGRPPDMAMVAFPNAAAQPERAPDAPLTRPTDDLDERARQLVAACLVLAPQRRPSVERLLEELETFKAAPVATPRPTAGRRRSRGLALALTLTAGTALAVAILLQGRRAAVSPPQARASVVVSSTTEAPPLGAPLAVATPPPIAPLEPVTARVPVVAAATAEPSAQPNAEASVPRRRHRSARGTRVPHPATVAIKDPAAGPPPPASTEAPRAATSDPKDIIRDLRGPAGSAPKDILLNPFQK